MFLSIGLSQSGLDVMAYVEAAEGELTDIFKKAKSVTCYPKKLTTTEAAATPPSQAGKAFEANVFSGLPQKELALFTGHIERLMVEVVKLLSPPNRHNNTYWSGFINSLLFDLADGFTTERERNEAEVRAQLSEPLLKKITKRQRKCYFCVCVRVGGGSHSPPNSWVMLYDFPRPSPAPVTVYTCHGDKPSVSLYIYSQVW